MKSTEQILHNYDNFNFWQLDLNEFPSRGRLYPKNAKIRARSMSVLEVKYLATLSPQNATDICNELLEKCTILENIKYEDLLLSDREFIIFWIRLNSFISSNGFTITIPECLGCHKKIEYTIKLMDLEFQYLDKPFVNKIYLPDLDFKLPLRMPRYNDSKIPVHDDIDEVCLWIDTDNTMEEKYRFVSNLTANDFIILKTHVDNNYCGVKKLITIECPECHMPHNVKIEIDDQNLFSNVDLMQILETITRIAKYSNLQITNDWSWVEVEVEQQIINKMITEENEANQKEIAKAKSQMPSKGSIPHASLPSYSH
jgi:hypothetical protein